MNPLSNVFSLLPTTYCAELSSNMLSIRTDWAVLRHLQACCINVHCCYCMAQDVFFVALSKSQRHSRRMKRSKDHMCLATLTAVFPHVELPLSSLLLKSFDRRYLLAQSVEAPGRSKFGIRPERSISLMPGPGN